MIHKFLCKLSALLLAGSLLFGLTSCQNTGDTERSSDASSEETSDSSLLEPSSAISTGGTPQSSSAAASSSRAPSSVAPPSSNDQSGGVDLMRLINKTHLLPDQYVPTLKSVDKNHKLDARCADLFKKMLDAAQRDGNKLYIASSYRTYARSQAIFSEDVKEYKAQGMSDQEAYDEAAKYVAPPGTSEHNSGLAVDVVNDGWYNTHSKLTAEFDKTQAYQWLSENAYKYGFILRYPKDKVDVTKYAYEPWHYRFVGVENAQKIKSSGKCLEEYLGILD